MSPLVLLRNMLSIHFSPLRPWFSIGFCCVLEIIFLWRRCWWTPKKACTFFIWLLLRCHVSILLQQICISELDEGNGCRHITWFPANIPNKSNFKQFFSELTNWNVNRKLLFCLKHCSFCRFAWYWDWRNHINKHWFPSWTSFIFPSVFEIVEAPFLMFAGWYIGPDVHLRRSSWAFHPGPLLGIDGWWTHGRGLPRWASTRVRVTRKRRQVTWRMGWSWDIFGLSHGGFPNHLGLSKYDHLMAVSATTKHGFDGIQW